MQVAVSLPTQIMISWRVRLYCLSHKHLYVHICKPFPVNVNIKRQSQHSYIQDPSRDCVEDESRLCLVMDPLASIARGIGVLFRLLGSP